MALKADIRPSPSITRSSKNRKLGSSSLRFKSKTFDQQHSVRNRGSRQLYVELKPDYYLWSACRWQPRQLPSTYEPLEEFCEYRMQFCCQQQEWPFVGCARGKVPRIQPGPHCSSAQAPNVPNPCPFFASTFSAIQFSTFTQSNIQQCFTLSPDQGVCGMWCMRKVEISIKGGN